MQCLWLRNRYWLMQAKAAELLFIDLTGLLLLEIVVH
jgi:hypothetical protein